MNRLKKDLINILVILLPTNIVILATEFQSPEGMYSYYPGVMIIALGAHCLLRALRITLRTHRKHHHETSSTPD